MRTLILIVILALCGVWIYLYPPDWVSNPDWLNSVPGGSAVLDAFKPPKKVWQPPSPNTVYPREWITTDGKTYRNVKVISVEADAINIMHADGVTLVETATLPRDIQKLVNYDPDLAAEAAADRQGNESQQDQAFTAAEQAKADQQQKDFYQSTGSDDENMPSDWMNKINSSNKQEYIGRFMAGIAHNKEAERIAIAQYRAQHPLDVSNDAGVAAPYEREINRAYQVIAYINQYK